MEGTGELNATEDNVTEVSHVKRKENDNSEPENHNRVGSSGIFISPESDWPEHISIARSPEVFTETVEGKILARSEGSESGGQQLQTETLAGDNEGLTVEELTLNNYKSSHLSVLGCSNSRDLPLTERGQWQHLYQLADGVGSRSLLRDDMSKEPTGGQEDMKHILLPKSWVQKPQTGKKPKEDHAEISENLVNRGNGIVLGNSFGAIPGGIRTKVLPASGFSQFFVKNTLKGKGVVYRWTENHRRPNVMIESESNEKVGPVAVCNTSHCSMTKTDNMPRCSNLGAVGGISMVDNGISLREWLKKRSTNVNKDKSLNIFRQILEQVDLAHSQGITLQRIRPSCFLILPSDVVKYVGTYGPQIQPGLSDTAINQDVFQMEHSLKRKMYLEQGMDARSLPAKGQKLSEHANPVGQVFGTSSRTGLICEAFQRDHANSFRSQNYGCAFRKQSSSQQPSSSGAIQLEERWYASPEEINGMGCTLSSNIYSLGVLLFELLCSFESWELHAAAMSDLRHRILPPNFLSRNPNEAGFCLWLLHPESSSRPKAREIQQSDFICKAKDSLPKGRLPLSVDEEDAESDLLLYFLTTLKEEKQKRAAKLVEDIGCLEADIEEVGKRHLLLTEGSSAATEGYSGKDTSTSLDGVSDDRPLDTKAVCRSSFSEMNEAMLSKSINQLEHAYFSMRSKIELSETDVAQRSDIDVLKNQDRWSSIQTANEECGMTENPTDRLGSFFDGLCKYARYSRFEVRGILRNGDLLNSANVICSLGFDRDEEYFAAAGVSKKIKIFEFGSLLNNTVDIHYPVIEMSSKSRLSCVCWNSYIKNYLASTDYDGVVQLWDAGTGQGFSRYTEHQKRAWSVDFSQVDPTKLASGSDDCSVKIWSINEERCISTIRNVANVCCVQFSSYSTHLLAFGSSDYKIYCYDLRSTRLPWCTLAGHGKAVSYVKFLDPCTMVSASTDSTLKLWDLSKTTASGLSMNACNLTLSGHANEKNFVGLSVSEGYVACGSETNEVYAYYRSLPMPITSHKFGSVDSITGQETGDDHGQFVSSVCWRGKANMVVAANSNGSIKLLQMV